MHAISRHRPAPPQHVCVYPRAFHAQAANTISQHITSQNKHHARPTLDRPLSFLMQKVSSSLLSSSADTQCLGGCRYRPHSLHQRMVAWGVIARSDQCENVTTLHSAWHSEWLALLALQDCGLQDRAAECRQVLRERRDHQPCTTALRPRGCLAYAAELAELATYAVELALHGQSELACAVAAASCPCCSSRRRAPSPQQAGNEGSKQPRVTGSLQLKPARAAPAFVSPR